MSIGLLIVPCCISAAEEEVKSGRPVTFLLVPAAQWNGGRPEPGAFLPEGRIDLYRRGDYAPWGVVEANEEIRLPPGEWTWIAEAPGYVSVDAGLLRISDAELGPKSILWTVVPACELDLGAANLSGLVRLDVVSLPYGATYPIIPGERPRRPVPAGGLIAYAVGNRGLEAISPVFSCRPGDVLPVERPAPPASDRQDLMVVARLDAETAVASDGIEAVVLPLRDGGGPGRRPSAATRAAGFATFFFLGLPAGDARRLELRHSELITERIDLPPLAGAVREIDRTLVPRITVEVAVDYRPRRPHRQAELSLLHCGAASRSTAPTCAPVSEPLELVAGLSFYRFAGVDAGDVVFEARIDGERLTGLGSGASLRLGRDDGPVFHAPADVVREFHLYGQLLLAGKPVDGEVQIAAASSAAALRRFPTDERRFYHVYYFGQQPPAMGLGIYPAELRERGGEALLSLPLDRVWRACDADGFCRIFPRWSTFTGDGRFDVELGQTRLRVRVSDAETGAAIAGALVLLRAPRGSGFHPVHVFDGRAHRAARPSGEGLGAYTGAQGEARLLLGEEDAHSLAVQAEGYEPLARALELPAAGGEIIELAVELMPRQPATGVTLLLEDGRPAARAAAVAIHPDGSIDRACTGTADAAGTLKLGPPCTGGEARRFLLFHPQARLERLPAAALRASATVVLPLRRGPPLVLRLREADGEPLAGVAFSLRYGDLVLAPDHLIAGRMPHRTGPRGEARLPFIDAGGELPELYLPATGRAFFLHPDDDGVALVETEAP